MKQISYIPNFEEWRKEFQFFHRVKVRFSETDLFGHLNNTVPFVYFEDARIEFFKHLGFLNRWLDPDIEEMPVVADLQCDFHRQVYFDEQLRIYVKVAKVGTSSIDLHYLGTKEDGTVCFTGRGTIVQISRRTGKSVPLTGKEKEKFFHVNSVSVK
ncbi:acyl-CoA thioesterase [Aeribacillus pallidus]|uniref:acyl-CoA thioesterase n=1 Tax=Aeribacillus pallidus TaxID=33936 RepID=UPI003D1CA306